MKAGQSDVTRKERKGLKGTGGGWAVIERFPGTWYPDSSLLVSVDDEYALRRLM